MAAVPDLVAGGVMLSYRCTNTCRHCLYRCSPKRPDDWMSLEMAERVFAALAREPRLMSLHLAGGEAMLRFDLVVEMVRLAVAAGLPLVYMETNAHWCRDRDETREKLTILREAGLLSHFYTDACATKGWPRLARLIPSPVRPPSWARTP